LKKLWNKVLAKNTILMISTENSQITGAKHKEVVDIFSEDKTKLQFSKKAKEKQLKKYHSDIMVKIRDNNPCERYMYTRQDCLV